MTGNTIHEGIITIPWEYEGFTERFSISDFEAWTLEKIPSVKICFIANFVRMVTAYVLYYNKICKNNR